jgi:hypothetical protein
VIAPPRGSSRGGSIAHARSPSDDLDVAVGVGDAQRVAAVAEREEARLALAGHAGARRLARSPSRAAA